MLLHWSHLLLQPPHLEEQEEGNGREQWLGPGPCEGRQRWGAEMGWARARGRQGWEGRCQGHWRELSADFREAGRCRYGNHSQ